MPRPYSITVLALTMLALAAFNALGVLTAYRELAFLRTLPLTVSPLYFLASRAGWAVVLAVMAGGLWWLKPWGRVGALTTLTFYVAQVWLDRWMFDQTDFARLTQPYLFAASLISLGVVWGVLGRPEMRQRFRR